MKCCIESAWCWNLILSLLLWPRCQINDFSHPSRSLPFSLTSSWSRLLSFCDQTVFLLLVSFQLCYLSLYDKLSKNTALIQPPAPPSPKFQWPFMSMQILEDKDRMSWPGIHNFTPHHPHSFLQLLHPLSPQLRTVVHLPVFLILTPSLPWLVPECPPPYKVEFLPHHFQESGWWSQDPKLADGVRIPNCRGRPWQEAKPLRRNTYEVLHLDLKNQMEGRHVAEDIRVCNGVCKV